MGEAHATVWLELVVLCLKVLANCRTASRKQDTVVHSIPRSLVVSLFVWTALLVSSSRSKVLERNMSASSVYTTLYLEEKHSSLAHLKPLLVLSSSVHH